MEVLGNPLTYLLLLKEKEILTFPQPFSNHNGGQLAFGSEGYLYIATAKLKRIDDFLFFNELLWKKYFE